MEISHVAQSSLAFDASIGGFGRDVSVRHVRTVHNTQGGKLARNRETSRTRMGSRKCRVSIDISTLKNVCKQQSMTNQFVVAVLLSRIVHCVLVCYNV